MSNGELILAIDPGGTTGVALKFPNGQYVTHAITSAVELWALFQNPKPDRVVFEIFATGNRVDRYMIYTIELVGGIKALCEALNIKGYAHSPHVRKSFLSDAKTILRGQGTVVHEMDALAHLLAFEYRLARGEIK